MITQTHRRQPRGNRLCLAVLGGALLALTVGWPQQRAYADTSKSYTPGVDVSQYTVDTFFDWMKKYKDAKPDFKDGEVLTWKDKERLRPFVPPGYFEQLNFPEFKAVIKDPPADFTPDRPFQECTEKFQAQVRLNAKGLIENYVCGQPFPNSDLTKDDPITAGRKAAWNFEYRWQNYGIALLNLIWIWNQPGKSHESMISEANPVLPPDQWGINYQTFHLTTKWPSDAAKYLKGGGYWPRVLNSSHQRVYHTHLPQLPDKDYTLPLPGAKDIEYKEFTGFFSPFDIRGTAFIGVWPDSARHPYDHVQSWAYVPELRRVRRVSSEVRSDSLLGTDNTLDDFYGYSGHMPDWNFKFLGFKWLLVPVADRDYARLYGTEGMIPDSKWEVHRAIVVYRWPKTWAISPETALMFWDSQNYYTGYYFNFDRTKKLWKTNFYWGQRRDTVKAFAEMTKGLRIPQSLGHEIVNVQVNKGTAETFYGVGYPDVDLKHVRDLYDINKLEQVHR